MRTKSTVVAYAIAAIAAVAVVVLYFQNRSLEVRLNDMQAAVVADDAGELPEVPILPVEPDAVKKVRELTAKLAEANAQITALEEQLSDAETAAALETSEDAEAGEEAESEDGEDEDETRSLDEMREQIRDNAGVAAQVKALTEMAYADFFGAVELNTETKSALRQILVDSQLEQAALARYAIQEGVTGREYGEWKREERERLNEQVRALLTADNHAVWQEYEDAFDQRMLEATFENQLRAFSSGLTPDNHDTVMSVAVEEFLAEQWDLENSDEPFTQNANIQLQLDAMNAMRERLQPVMEEDQYNELDNWLTMGENVMRQGLQNIDEDTVN